MLLVGVLKQVKELLVVDLDEAAVDCHLHLLVLDLLEEVSDAARDDTPVLHQVDVGDSIDGGLASL